MSPQEIRDTLQQGFARLAEPLAATLARYAVTPNHVTAASLALCAVAALLVLQDRLLAAGAIWLLAGVLDLLDGLLARSQGQATAFGAFFDSTCDRIGEGLLFTAIVYRFAEQGQPVDAAAATFALLASLLVSYARARVEGLGGQCKVGTMTRAERVVLLGIGLILGWVEIVVYVLAIAAALTTVQRMREAHRVLAPPEGPGEA